MKIKVLTKTEGCFPLEFAKGDWIDLVAAEDTKLYAPHAKMLHRKKNEENTQERYRDVVFDYKVIPLGVAMQLPDGFEALLVPRSSTFKKHGILQVNAPGVIDQLYRGDNDIWGFPVVATRYTVIPKGTNICQFRIQLSQKATMWQKLKWLFSSKIELIPVSSLGNPDRKGFGEGTDSYTKTDNIHVEIHKETTQA